MSVVGAGGKTTLILRLADEARADGRRVLVTATTHMGRLSAELAGLVFLDAEGERGVAEALASQGRATLLGRRLREDKIEGVPPERVDALAGQADLVLVEADGARGRSLKVPAGHEPVVASSTTLVIVLAALDVLGQPLDAEHVHRVELVAEATGRPLGSVVDAETVAAALLHPGGYLSRVPAGARAGVFLNKAEGATAERIARRLVGPYRFVAAGSARSGEAICYPHPAGP